MTGQITQSTSFGGFGVAKVTTGATNGDQMQVFKDVAGVQLSADIALWHSFKVALTTSASTGVYIGFSDGGANDCYVRYDTSIGDTTWNLITSSAGTTTTGLVTGPTSVVFQTIDIVLMPGQFAAAWVDGDGPYVSTVNIPATGTTTRIQHIVVTNSGVTHSILLDWTHFEQFLQPVHPTLLYS